MVQKIAAVALRKWRRGENKRFLVGLLLSAGSYEVKGNLPQKIVYGPNLIFWIVMGCGRARFGRKGQ